MKFQHFNVSKIIFKFKSKFTAEVIGLISPDINFSATLLHKTFIVITIQTQSEIQT